MAAGRPSVDADTVDLFCEAFQRKPGKFIRHASRELHIPPDKRAGESPLPFETACTQNPGKASTETGQMAMTERMYWSHAQTD